MIQILKGESPGKLVDHLFRHEAGRMVAVLSRKFGLANIQIAEDIVQDTLLAAMNSWRFGNVPDNPKAWLYKVAQNKVLDWVRREKTHRGADAIRTNDLPYVMDDGAEWHDLFLETEIHDSVLRMIFACCHPVIPIESQLALALKTLGGMTSQEIASAFLTSADTVNKRIYRAREKIKLEQISLEVPTGEAMLPRLDAVLHVLYLMFNEGYRPSDSDQVIRRDLCFEAMRLCHLLAETPVTSRPSVNAVLALMCFQTSRIDARTDSMGRIVTLKNQERNKWNRPLIRKGVHYLDRAAETDQLTTYHLEAGIASIHASALSFNDTDWKSIYHLYEILYSFNPTPVVALNKAIAGNYAKNSDLALAELKQIKGLENNALYHASLGEVYFELGRKAEAKEHFASAGDRATSVAEKRFFMDRKNACE